MLKVNNVRCGPFRGRSRTSLLLACVLCKRVIPKRGFTGWRAYRRKKFCSEVCSKRWSVGQNNPQWKRRIPKPCLLCGAPIPFPIDEPPANRNRKYCSAECRRKYLHPHVLCHWKGYKVDGYSKEGKAVFSHVAKAEKALGRHMRKGEVVHHVNGNRADDRNCNLLICTRPYHTWLHQEMSRRYMQEHFANL